MSIAHYVCFVFCVYMFSCSCCTLLSHFVYWIVLSAGLAIQPNYSAATTVDLHIISCTVVVVVE